MSLRMATPQTNRFGIYIARLWVPVDLQQTLKKKEVVRSLRTRDAAEAKRKFKMVVAEFDSEWEQLRVASQFVAVANASTPQPRAINEKEAHALAGEFYRTLIAQHEDNPGSPDIWERQLRAIQRSLPKRERLPGMIVPFVDDNSWAFHPARNAYWSLGQEVREFLDGRKDNLEARSFMLLCSKVALAKRDAFERLLRHATGDFAPDPKEQRFPPIPPSTAAVGQQGPGVEVEELLELWRGAPGISAKTFKSWSGKLRMLMKFAGKTDVAQLTTLEVEQWRDHRIDQGISTSTVSSGDLAGVRAILAWAKSNTKVPAITANVAENVRQKKVKKPKLGSKGYELGEANTILAATLQPAGERMTQTGAAARRWVPWLCAYSGARAGEIGQLHSSNIFQDETPDGDLIWCMRLTPEDGSIKTHEMRIVPLHPHILEQAFLDYVASRRGKPLFYEPSRRRGSSKGHRQSDKVGERLAAWIRELGIVRDVQPNHAWRHRFETLGRVLEIRTDVVDSITGHTPSSVAAEYGDYLTQVKFNAICKMPRYLQPKRAKTIVVALDG